MGLKGRLGERNKSCGRGTRRGELPVCLGSGGDLSKKQGTILRNKGPLHALGRVKRHKNTMRRLYGYTDLCRSVKVGVSSPKAVEEGKKQHREVTYHHTLEHENTRLEDQFLAKIQP